MTVRGFTQTFLILASLTLGLTSEASAAPSRPFPRHTAYTAGTILPNHKPRAVLDQAVRDFYDAWKELSCVPAAVPAATTSRSTAGRARSTPRRRSACRKASASAC